MKKNILLGTLFASALLFAGCDYNEDNFPGYDEYTHAKDVRNDTVTLVKADYKKIAGLDANKELALSKDPEGETYVKALEQIVSNGFFTEEAPALWYLPAYIESLYPYLSNNSKILVNYQNAENLPEYMADFNGIKDYTLTSDDYTVVWNDRVTASFISPSTVQKLPEVLKAAKPNAKAGDMLLVNYAYSETEPSIGGGGDEPEPSPTYTSIADVLKATSGTYTSKGEVIAVNAKSFIFSDGTGNIRVYRGSLPTCAVGDVVEVSGEVENKQELTRFRSKATFKVLERKEKFSYPTATSMNTADMVAYVSAPDIRYVSYEGTLKISGTNVNILLDGEETIQGSVTDALILDESLKDKKVVVTGYLAGVSGGKYINTFATSIVLKGETNTITPVGVIALSEKGEYTAEGIVSATYTKGFMLTDGTGSILVYKNEAPIEKIGDLVQVTGSTSAYNGLMQFGNKGLNVKPISENNNAVTSMVPQVFVADDFNAYLTAPRPVYVTFEGKLTIEDSGNGFNYYNVAVDGVEKTLSLSYVDDYMVDPALNGKKVIINSYLIGVKNSAYVQAMLVSITEATATAAATAKAFAITRAAVKANASAIYRYDATSWRLYEPNTKEAKLAIMQPADYVPMGYTSISKPSETLPVYLTKAYPYAKANEKRIVTYYYYNSSDKSTTVAATEFTYDGTTWVETATDMPASMMFVKSNDKWVEAKVYYESSFLDGDNGGFTIQDIELEGISAVWTNEKSYGWKATGYSGSSKTAESWIVSPEISLKKSAAPALKFDAAVNFLKEKELSKYFVVKVSTDYVDDVTKATWTDLTIEGWPEEDSWSFVSVTPYDLSAYKEQTIRLAFQYKSKSDDSVAPTIEIKNLSVQE